MGMLWIGAVYIALALLGLALVARLCAKRHWVFASFAAVLFVALLPAWYQATKLDAVAALFYRQDTVYAAGFSERAFEHVKFGQVEDEARRILGDPLDHKVFGEKEYWYYSKAGPRFKNYWNRIVVVDLRTRKVVEVFKEFYTD